MQSQSAKHAKKLSIPLVERFAYFTVRHSSEPRDLVDYIRRPYMNNGEMNFRVTFDAKIKAVSPLWFCISGSAFLCNNILTIYLLP